MAIGKRMRFECFKRDQFQCQYCGRTPPQVVLEADHIVPVAGGGPDSLDNLATACFDCNRGKSDVPLSSVPRAISEVMDEAAEKREQMEAYSQFLLEVRAEEDERIREIGTSWFDRMVKPKDRGKWVFGADRSQSVRTFIRRMSFAHVLEAVDIAHSRVNATFDRDDKCWKYFCGVCWAKIRELEG